jgi:surface polysaccharide O-acyltransferase-like enzyme
MAVMASAPSLLPEGQPPESLPENAASLVETDSSELSDSTPKATAKASARLEWIDVFRGLAIVAVAMIHTIGSGLSVRHPPDTSWYCMTTVKSLLQFAVPAFLMLSSLVLTRSLLRDAAPGRYIRNRLQTVLWPTIVWTLLCIPYAHWLRPDFSWHETAQRVWEGTAQFHLYFLRVLLQLCLFLPLILPLARKRPPFWLVLPLTVATTLGFFFCNRYIWHISTPASWLFWYVPSVMLGLWLAGQSERWPTIARRGWLAASLLMVSSGALYLSFAIPEAEGNDPRSVFYPISQWCFVAGASFLLFCFAVLWCERPKKVRPSTLPLWRLLGSYSLQIYLLHPVVLAWLQKVVEPHFVTGFISLKLLILLLGTRLILCIAIPLAFAWILEKCRISALLFGR